MNFEEMWDYSYELLEEISRLVSDLPESNFITSNKFIDINNKLNKAKSLWINVSKYEVQIYNFRCSLLKRKISDKIKKINKLSNIDHWVLDISSIENNYLELKNDFENLWDVENSFQQLQNIIVQTKIWWMIQKYVSWELTSSFDFENIIREINNAKSKNIDVHELEMLMLWD
jgi:hypothetical protein